MNYQVGDVVTYETWHGTLCTGVITGKYADVKNGLPGFDMTTQSGKTVWGYDEQIIAVS